MLPSLLTPLRTLALLSLAAPAPDSLSEAALAARVEIVRTEYGIPHILAEDFEAMGFALAWVQSEDYGDVVAKGLTAMRGGYGMVFGHLPEKRLFLTRVGNRVRRQSCHATVLSVQAPAVAAARRRPINIPSKPPNNKPTTAPNPPHQ